jgi:UDP-N-acetylglucosamine pyrophosphorylase
MGTGIDAGGPKGFSEFAAKMRAAGVNEAAIRAFEYSYRELLEGETGLIPEQTLEPVEELPRMEEVVGETGAGTGRDEEAGAILGEVAVLKLNGGLGTSMGLEGPKSLLPVKDGLTFLDFIARGILHWRRAMGGSCRFRLLNSFSTSAETLGYLERYPELGPARDLEVMQSQVPKVDAATLRPAEWPRQRQLEWCPPGHGDLYPSLYGSGQLDDLLRAGVRVLFVSNSDNLGGTLDLGLLRWFLRSGMPFMMEVAERTVADRKGGHLARRGGRLILRELAQCPEQDLGCFQDVKRHRYFNTNNVWIRLDRLKEVLERNGGYLRLPVIRNRKRLDPREKGSPEVIQLETAMGAAIECFDGAGAVVVPRSRFAPVKTTADLLGLRSDAYEVTEDWRLELAPGGRGQPPVIDLDSAHYGFVDQLDECTRGGVPSLKECAALSVRGLFRFRSDNVFRGRVRLENASGMACELPPGVYADCTWVAR